MAGIADVSIFGLRDDKRTFPLLADPATLSVNNPRKSPSSYVPHEQIDERD